MTQRLWAAEKAEALAQTGHARILAIESSW